MKLTDTLYLNRSGRYTDPLNGNDRLPIVYGDLTDGTNGVWELPCIDTDGGGMNPVYCFAGHAVLSAANGNTVTIYEDGQELNAALYTFDESNDYESEGIISTITFQSPKVNATITARGKGKASGATLIENAVDIIYDILTVECDFLTSLFDSTSKSTASQIFTAQGYKAAGVINDDIPIWDVLTKIMGSFLGSTYVNGSGNLVLSFDRNTVADYYGHAAIIPFSSIILNEAKLRIVNIVNQCPCNYAYNYYDGEFKKETDDISHADIMSQNIFGVLKPNTPYQFYWCRDLTTVQKVQDIIVAKLKNPIYEVALTDISSERLILDVGDTVTASIDSLYDDKAIPLWNQYWKVVSLKADIQNNKMDFRLLQLPGYMYYSYLADGSFLADGTIKAGDNRDLTIY